MQKRKNFYRNFEPLLPFEFPYGVFSETFIIEKDGEKRKHTEQSRVRIPIRIIKTKPFLMNRGKVLWWSCGEKGCIMRSQHIDTVVNVFEDLVYFSVWGTVKLVLEIRYIGEKVMVIIKKRKDLKRRKK
ncbi:MAG: hypothetical protein AB1465_03015 [Patescibacteria group bacterium]